MKFSEIFPDHEQKLVWTLCCEQCGAQIKDRSLDRAFHRASKEGWTQRPYPDPDSFLDAAMYCAFCSPDFDGKRIRR